MEFCKWCSFDCRKNGLILIELFCPIYIKKKDYMDAAEFEARVAARLAERDDSYQRCGKCPSRFKGVSCYHDAKSCRLLCARIVVEEEMDG